MHLINYLGNALLKRRAKAGKTTSDRYPIFKDQVQNTVIILDKAHVHKSTQNAIEKVAKPNFGKITFLIIDLANNKESHDSGVLSMYQIDFRGRLKKNAPELTCSKTPDALINTLTWTLPRLELFLLEIKAPLKIRFDRESEIFYNFIVSNESKNALEKMSDLIEVYKALSK